MALNTLKCNYLTPFGFKGLNFTFMMQVVSANVNVVTVQFYYSKYP